jgi:hypothetical protein
VQQPGVTAGLVVSSVVAEHTGQFLLAVDEEFPILIIKLSSDFDLFSFFFELLG